MKRAFIYIMASQRNGTLYVEVTSELVYRTYEHREGLIKGFTKKYHVHHLVYYEEHPTLQDAITREKQLKEWKRSWKIQLIEKTNPEWNDLYPDIAVSNMI